MRIFVVSFISLFLLAACSVSKLPPTNSYTLDVGTANSSIVKNPQNKVIRIAAPRSTAAITSRNILYQDRRYTLNAYAFSRWSDTPNRMLANVFMTALIDNALFKVVLPADSSGKHDYVLESSLQEFHQQIHADGTSSAIVRIGFYLIESKSAKVIASKEISVSHPADMTNAAGGVAAFNQATQNINQQLIGWLSSIQY